MRTKIAQFGFELEGEFSNPLLEKLRRRGTIKSDGSINSCPTCDTPYNSSNPSKPRLMAYEFITAPIEFKKRYNSKELFKLLDEEYKEKNYHWNRSMGFHIHISFENFTSFLPPEIKSVEFVKYFLSAVKNEFPAEYERRKDNRFCSCANAERDEAGTAGSIINGDRYNAVNFKAFQAHRTIEIRLFPTNKPLKMYEYLTFTMKCVDKFLRRGKFNLIKEVELEDLDLQEEFGDVLRASNQEYLLNENV